MHWYLSDAIANEAVEAWSKVWASKIFQDLPSSNFDNMILATYLLDIQYEFHQVTFMLARDRDSDNAAVPADLLPIVSFDGLHVAGKTPKSNLLLAWTLSQHVMAIVRRLERPWVNSWSITVQLDSIR
jgi:hypothetical protein